MNNFITIVACAFFFTLGAVAGHFHGKSTVYETMVAGTSNAMAALK